jgi:NTP pyrophosphatase (non-canonical NTP hydrolase)
MRPLTYIQNAKRTEVKKYIFGKTREVTPRIEHGIFGIVAEAGELMNAIRKAKIYGHELDKVNLIEEVGDVMWYLAILCDELGVSFETVWDKNIRKLKARYPEKFTNIKFKKRDLVKERKELER